MTRRMRIALPLAVGAVAAGGAYAALDERDPPVRAAGETAVRTTAAGDTTATGRALFARMGCGSCHTFAPAGTRGDFGPSLDDKRLSAAAVRAKIVDPYPGSMAAMGMPEDYARRMRPGELDALAAFVAARAPD